jgi:GNAT superfamily N-acetyltransferase
MSLRDTQIEVFPATALEDVELLRPVLESAVRNPITQEVITGEVGEVLEEVERVRQGQSDRYYAIARNSGNAVLGMMGLQAPGQEMLALATAERPVELINAYVLSASRGRGIGQALVNHLETKARTDGHSELILNSGPRYMLSGWPFWQKLYGEPVERLVDYYGPRFDAMVWRKLLTDKKID